MQTHPEDKQEHPLPAHLIVYAYCLMSNHVPLLVREQAEGLVPPIKSIAISYAQYFNYKYEHSGQLFQDRFKSEPVNDLEYFVTLLRYIHQNPIAGGLVSKVRDYRWSSWREFDPEMNCDVPVCCTNAVLSKISFDALKELIDEPLPKIRRILDFDSDTGMRVSDDRLREYIKAGLEIDEVSQIQHLSREERNEVIIRLLEFCRNVMQISRVTGISRGVIIRLDK